MDLPSLFAKVSHDLKSPLRQIKSFVQLLESDPKLDEDQKQLVAMLVEIADKGINQVVGFEHFAKAIDVQGVVYEMAFTDIVKSVALDHKNLEIRGLGACEFEIVFNQQALKVILNEILSNAQKFCPESTAPVLDIDTAVDEATGARSLKFTSPSVGVSHDKLEKLFVAYSRDPRAEGTEGFGMGLTIVSYLVDQAGGSLSLSLSDDQAFSVLWTLAPEGVSSSPQAA